MADNDARGGGWLIRGLFGFQTALSGVMTHKLRSFLTVLGVMIGVASLIVLLAIGNGARVAIAEQFQSLGVNLIKVQSNRWDVRLSIDDAGQLKERVPGVVEAMPVVRGEEVQLRYRRAVLPFTVMGVTESFPGIRDHGLLTGRFFSRLHVSERMRVAVLGHDAWRRLFGSLNPVGQGLYLEGQRFTVLGVLEKKGEGMADGIDEQIIVPITAAQRVLLTGRVDELWLKAADAGRVQPAVAQVGRILRRQFNIREEKEGDDSEGTPPEEVKRTVVHTTTGGKMVHEIARPEIPDQGAAEEPPLTVTSVNSLVEEASEASRVMTMMLAGIASVALLVGGLGIMNIMLVSVSERTREIGIRKALGAHPGDLIYQFMVEALLLSAAGGALGIAAGYAGAGLACTYGLQTYLTLRAVLVAFVAAVGVGIVFGVYPAYAAADLEPVEALRHR